MKTAAFGFDASLNDLLSRAVRPTTGALSFTGPQSAKHLIESLGIPHTEVGALTVNGQSADLSYLVRDGDRIYRIKSPLEEHERVVSESLLVRSEGCFPDRVATLAQSSRRGSITLPTLRIAFDEPDRWSLAQPRSNSEKSARQISARYKSGDACRRDFKREGL